MGRRTVALGLVLALDVCLAARAAAHGSPPEVTQVMVQDPHAAVIATTRGILFGDPTAGRWSLLCGKAFGVPVGIPYRIARLPSGRLYVANLGGMRISDDQGCTWRKHPVLGDLDITHMYQDPTHPERILVTLFGAAEGGIRASDDGGETFRVLYRAADDEFVNSLLVAPGDAQQLYATLSTTAERSRLFALRSGDGGRSWQRSELSLRDDVIDVSVLAVNPVDAREVLVRVRYADQWNGDHLLSSRDGGQTFVELARHARISDAVFSADGATRFMVTSDGMFRASTPAGSFVRADVSQQMTYAAVLDSKLLVSGYYVTDNRLNVSVWSTAVSDPSAPLASWLSFADVTTARTCPAPSKVDTACLLDWLDFSQEFLPLPD